MLWKPEATVWQPDSPIKGEIMMSKFLFSINKLSLLRVFLFFSLAFPDLLLFLYTDLFFLCYTKHPANPGVDVRPSFLLHLFVLMLLQIVQNLCFSAQRTKNFLGVRG